MRILVTNDDGLNAPGLWPLAAELRTLGTVTVVVPDREQSGMGTAVSLLSPVRMSSVASPLPGVDAYSVEGTPADSAILGIRVIAGDALDLVVSGINQGRNLGDDVFISGTVGAAMQGYFHGIPSVAVSVASIENVRFGPAAKLVKLVAGQVQQGVLHGRMLLNINFPNVAAEEIAGLSITRLGEQSFNFNIEEAADGRKGYYWIRRGRPKWKLIPGSDRWAVDQKRISLTALLAYSDDPILPVLRDLAPELYRQLLSPD